MATLKKPPTNSNKNFRGRSENHKEHVDDPVKVITKYGRSLEIASWEINAFISLCKSKNSLIKGQRIILEYSHLRDDIYTLLSKRNSYTRKILSVISNHSLNDIIVQLPGHIKKLTEYSLKSWISICRWRQLQWTPRPISVNIDGTKSSLINFHLEFESQLHLLHSKFKEYQTQLLNSGVDINHLILYLITSSCEYLKEESALRLADFLYPQNSILSQNFNQTTLLTPFHELIELFIQLFTEEKTSYNTWKQFTMTNSSAPSPSPSPSSPSPSSSPGSNDDFPVLAVRYNDIVPTTRSDNEQSFHELYSRATHQLLSFFYKHFAHDKRIDLSTQLNSHDEILSLMKALNKVETQNPSMNFPALTASINNSQEKNSIDDESIPPTNSLNYFYSADPNNNSQFDSEISLTRDYSHDATSVTSTSMTIQTASTPINDISLTRHSFVFPKKTKSTSSSERRPLSSGAVLTSRNLSSNSLKKTPSLPRIHQNESPRSQIPLRLFSQNQPTPRTPRYLDVTSPLAVDDQLCFSIDTVQRRDSLNKIIIHKLIEPGCLTSIKNNCRVGDEILAVNGINLRGKSIPEAYKILKFAGGVGRNSKKGFQGVGPSVHLRLQRPAEMSSSPVEMMKNTSSTLASDNSHLTAEPGQQSSSLGTILLNLEEEFHRLENILGGTANINSFIEMKENLMKQIHENKLLLGASSEILPTPFENEISKETSISNQIKPAPDTIIPPPILVSNSVTSSPNLHQGAKVMRKSIIKNKLDRIGSKEKILHTTPKGEDTSKSSSKSFPFVSLSVHTIDPPIQKWRSDSEDSSTRSPVVHFTSTATAAATATPNSISNSNQTNSFFFPDSARSSTCSASTTTRSVTPQSHPHHHLHHLHPNKQNNHKKRSQRKFLSKSSLLILREALKSMNAKYLGPTSKQNTAAAKIQIWWKLILPQKKLYFSRWVKEICQDWVYELFDSAYEKTIQVRRIRRQIMREGAAMKIQRRFRLWRERILGNCLQIQRFWRRCLARNSLRVLVNHVRAGLQVARFLYYRRRKLRQPVGKKQIYQRVLKGYFETIGIRLREKKLKESTQPRLKIFQTGNSSSRLGGASSHTRQPRQLDRKEIELSKQRKIAVARIQALVRRWAAVKHVINLRKEKRQHQQICLTRVLGKMLLLIKKHQHKRKAAIKIASYWRGCSARWKLMIKILASFKIRSCWRSYKEYWKLKRCLRRGEAPITIILHSMKNIPTGILTTGTMKVRVSVWWSSLLHLVEKKTDFLTIIQSKPPNIIRTTSLFPSEEQLVETLSIPSRVLKPPIMPRKMRKLSLTEQTRRLLPHESCRRLTEADKLSEFARQHMKRNSLNSPSFSHSQRNTEMSCGRTIGNLNPPPIHETNEDSASNSESSNLDLHTPVRDRESSSSSSSSDSDEDEDEDEEEQHEGQEKEEERKKEDENKLKEVFPSKSSPIKPYHRLSSDNIGRDCTNLIGSNLISETSYETSSAMGATLDVAKKILQTSLSIDIGTTTFPATPSRVLLKPVSRSEHDSKSSQSTLSAFSDNIINALKPTSLPTHADYSRGTTKLTVNLHDETLYIPGCHGNSVIRFDFFDGEVRKVGSYIYELADEKTLMFWGGEHVNEILLTPLGKRIPTNRPGSIPVAIFDVRIASGTPRCSRCGWTMICVKGSGPLKRKIRTKNLIKSFFDPWENFFLSLDGESLYLYLARNSPEPFFTIPLSQLKHLHVELAVDHHQHHQSRLSDNSKMSVMEDRFLVVLLTSSHDVIQLKFQDRATRENWVRTIVHGVRQLR